jgi:branched-chain amino acid transport system substrate-binding protein
MLVLCVFSVSCEQVKDINIRDIELQGIEKDTTKVRLKNVYPMFDPFHKVYEPSSDVEFPEGETSLDITEVDDKDIVAIYYPLVSMEEKNEFYRNRYGSGRALNIKVFVRQSNFDKRLIRNDYWYPYPEGVTIEGTVEEVPELVLNDYKFWENNPNLDLPPIIIDENPILINVEKFIPNIKDSFNIKVGAIIEKKDFVYPEEVKKGLSLALEYVLEESQGIYNTDRELKVIIKEVNNTEEAKTALNQLYTDDEAVFTTAFTSNETAKQLLPIAEEHKKLLFIDSAYDDEITGSLWNKFIFKVSPNIYQRAKSIVHSIEEETVRAIIVTQDNLEGRIAYRAIEEVTEEKGFSIVEHFSIDTDNDINYQFSELNNIDKLGATHIIVFWDILEKDPQTAMDYSPVSVLLSDEWQDKMPDIQLVFEIPPMTILNTLENADGSIGSTYYNYQLADTHLNDFLLDKAKTEDNIEYPTTGMCQGFTTGYIAFNLINRSSGNFDIVNLIELLENREYITPKGFIKFREEDHVGLQFMYPATIKEDDELSGYSLEPIGRGMLRHVDTEPPIIKQ